MVKLFSNFSITYIAHQNVFVNIYKLRFVRNHLMQVDFTIMRGPGESYGLRHICVHIFKKKFVHIIMFILYLLFLLCDRVHHRPIDESCVFFIRQKILGTQSFNHNSIHKPSHTCEAIS